MINLSLIYASFFSLLCPSTVQIIQVEGVCTHIVADCTYKSLRLYLRVLRGRKGKPKEAKGRKGREGKKEGKPSLCLGVKNQQGKEMEDLCYNFTILPFFLLKSINTLCYTL